MDESTRQQLRDIILTDSEKRKLNREVWPWDEYCVPPTQADLEASDARGFRTKYTNPAEHDALFYMPPDKHDFECHECGGQYGPWVHGGFSVNVDGGYSSKPIYANILHKRNRWCEDCGYEFYNCYAVGEVHFERSEKGILSFDNFK